MEGRKRGILRKERKIGRKVGREVERNVKFGVRGRERE